MSAAGNRWVTFDCFGTLVDWQQGFAEILAPVARGRVDEIVREYYACERRVERQQPHRSYRDVLVAALVAAGEQAGVAIGPSDAETLPRAWGALRPFADTETLLAELRARGYRLAVLTNCDDDLFEITHRRFRAPFDLFVTAESVRGYKPAPWHFRAFELLTGAARCDWVHVSGSWYHDIAPARALGVRRVWLDREQTGEDPSYASAYVRTAGDALQAIEALFADRTAEVACVA